MRFIENIWITGNKPFLMFRVGNGLPFYDCQIYQERMLDLYFNSEAEMSQVCKELLSKGFSLPIFEEHKKSVEERVYIDPLTYIPPIPDFPFSSPSLLFPTRRTTPVYVTPEKFNLFRDTIRSLKSYGYKSLWVVNIQYQYIIL